MKKLTLDEHRNRIINLSEANAKIIGYRRRLRISDYSRSQVTYNLGDYPARFTITPTEYDFNLLKKFSEDGVQLIQIREEWNDSIRLYGADKYSSHESQWYETNC